MTLAELIAALEHIRDEIGADPDVPVMLNDSEHRYWELSDVAYLFADRTVDLT